MKNPIAGVVLLLLASVCSSEILDKKISFAASSGHEFYHLCKSLEVVCGIEVDFTVYRDIGSLELRDIAGRKGLAAVLSRYPGHRWEFRDGTLFVYPRRRSEKSPLDRHVSSIRLNNQSLDTIRGFFAKEMRLEGSSFSVTGHGNGSVGDSSRISLEARNIVIRDALTRIVKSHGHAMWSVDRYLSSDGHPFYSLELKSYEQHTQKLQPPK